GLQVASRVVQPAEKPAARWPVLELHTKSIDDRSVSFLDKGLFLFLRLNQLRMKIQSKFTFLAVVSLFLFAMPEITRAQQAHVKLFAHRGGSYEFEENTLEAFRSSYGQGIRGFETDI